MDETPTESTAGHVLEERSGRALVESSRKAATAESLTGGAISAALSAIKGASDSGRRRSIAECPDG